MLLFWKDNYGGGGGGGGGVCVCVCGGGGFEMRHCNVRILLKYDISFPRNSKTIESILSNTTI